MPTVSGLQETYRLIRPQMEDMEGILSGVLQDDSSCVNEMLQYASHYSGKRLRPALVFLVAEICGETTDEHAQLAAVVELIHLATLVHDDILDQATIRRSVASVNTRWNTQDAVLLGDIIFSRAINLLVKIGHRGALEKLTTAVSTICEGEIMQDLMSRDPGIETATYMDFIHRKTASLYAAACCLAAEFSHATEELTGALENFGMSLGVSFQIVDDCLDFSGDEDVVGKSLGTDILGGKMTLPIIHLLEKLDGPDREKLEGIIRGSVGSGGALDFVREQLEHCGSIEYAMGHAERITADALSQMRGLLEPGHMELIENVAGFVLNRRR